MAGQRQRVGVGRQAARAILIDDDGRLVLIRRTKPGQAPYWTTPGGGVEASDASVEAALHRELAEELGAEASGATRVFLVSAPSEAGVDVQHFFVARMRKLDESARSGPEFLDDSRGTYDVDRIALLSDDLASVDLKPDALKEFILANREALLAEAALQDSLALLLPLCHNSEKRLRCDRPFDSKGCPGPARRRRDQPWPTRI